MAEDRDSGSSEDGYTYLWRIIGFIFIMVVIVNAIDNSGAFDQTPSNDYVNQSSYGNDNTASVNDNENVDRPSNDDSTNKATISHSGSILDIFSKDKRSVFPPPGEIAQGESVISEREIVVRQTPAGEVLGTQKWASKGIVIDGPLTAYGDRWWMIDYEDAPDGWVREADITKRKGLFYFVNFFPITLGFLKWLGWILSILFLFGIIYSGIKYRLTPDYVDTSVGKPKDEVIEIQGESAVPVPSPENNERWQAILLQMKSHNSSDWKHAIIDADIILEEMLEGMGYKEGTIGDKLKAIEPSDMATLDDAWEAHKVRNRIAHEGNNFVISQAEAQRVIDLYRKVFEEFFYI